MKKIYLYLLLLTCFGCKKSSDTVTPATPPVPAVMNIKINSPQLFSYNITEVDTVTNDFYVKDGYDVTSLDYTFTPGVGHKIILEATTKPNTAITAAVTYKGKVIGPVNVANNTDHTDVTFSYVVPK